MVYVSDEAKWILVSLIYFVNCGLIILAWIFGGVRHWPKVQTARFILLMLLMGYCVFGPLGAIRDGNAFSDRHGVLACIGCAGIVILTWSVYAERKKHVIQEELKRMKEMHQI